jgi:hypothetical protein
VCESCARALEIHAKFLSRIEQFRREFPGGSQAFMDVSGTAHCMMGIPVKVNIDSGRKPNGIPERR